MFAYKASFEFDWITFIDSLMVSPLFAAKKCYENLISTTSACWILKLDRQNHNITAALMHSFRVWYTQCLARRLTLNLIEFIHLKVWRSFDSLAVKNFMKNWTTTTSAACLQNSTARLSFQNCLTVIPIFSRETSFSLNWMHPIENLTVI